MLGRVAGSGLWVGWWVTGAGSGSGQRVPVLSRRVEEE